MYSLYSVFVNDADLGVLGISLQLSEDFTGLSCQTWKNACCCPSEIYLFFNEFFEKSSYTDFPSKYRTKEINYNFSNHDYGFLCSSQEIPDEGTYFISGRKAKCERRKLLKNFRLAQGL